jgi:hypothetical protein
VCGLENRENPQYSVCAKRQDQEITAKEAIRMKHTKNDNDVTIGK